METALVKPLNISDNGQELKKLRCQLGWCQAEMARRLACDLDLVVAYESGSTLILEQHRHAIRGLANQAFTAAEKTSRRPVADGMMRELGLSQIHDFDVLRGIKEI